MSQVYLNINNQQAGPYSVETVNQMLSSNQAFPETLGWMQGMANWEALHVDGRVQRDTQMQLKFCLSSFGSHMEVNP